MKLQGNIVTPEKSGYGTLEWNGKIITSVEINDAVKDDENWILPGFIDVHLHGSGNYNIEDGEDQIRGMVEFLPSKGVTRFLPTCGARTFEFSLDFVKLVAKLTQEQPAGSSIIGSHLEGPWLTVKFCGGMLPELIQKPSLEHAKMFWEASEGTLKLMTIAPENPEAIDVIKYLHSKGVVMSCGHSDCPPTFLKDAVDAGLSEMCHLFDSYNLPEDHGGVRQPALTDMALINDNLQKEIIMDGLHVPPELVILARRAAGADHIIAITDALQGAGLPQGRFFDNGKSYIIREDDLGRREEDGQIIGSALSMNRAFFNMTTRFGFTPSEASKSLSLNAARQLKLDAITGSLQVGKLADIAVLAPDKLTVVNTYLNGTVIA